MQQRKQLPTLLTNNNTTSSFTKNNTYTYCKSATHNGRNNSNEDCEETNEKQSMCDDGNDPDNFLNESNAVELKYTLEQVIKYMEKNYYIR